MLFRHKYRNRIEQMDESVAMGVTDYIENVVAHNSNVMHSVMVESESDLASLDNYAVGSIAYTAGFGNMWQLSASGEWVEM